MARTKPAEGATAEVILEFPRTGNPWIDAGVVGLYRVLNNRPAYADPPDGPADRVDQSAFPGVDCTSLASDRLTITGPADQVQACLERAYDVLVATYFSVSSEKQRTDKESYNFYYDSSSDDFILFPKKKAVGAASLLFDKAARPAGGQVPWGKGPDGKKLAGRMPDDYVHLQGRLDAFLVTNKLKPGPPAGLLIDGPNQVKPKVEIRVGAKADKAVCFLTGAPASAPVEAKETAFPLLGGSRSFINGSEGWPRLGWKADLVGKFVPAVAFYYLQGGEIHLFFPQSNDLRRVDELADILAGTMFQLERNLFRNFNFAPKVGGYFSRRSEVALAFLHCVFGRLTDQRRAEQARLEEAERPTGKEEPLFDDLTDSSEADTQVSADVPTVPETDTQIAVVPEPDPELLISGQDVFDATQKAGLVGFAIVSATKKGNVWMARDFWSFQDVVYLARLFAKMQRPIRAKTGRVFSLCQPEAFLRALLDFEANDESRSLLRDRVCEAILRRRPVLSLLERHAFHINKHSDARESRGVRPLLEFALLYEAELRKGTPMENDYEAMVKTARWLGDNVGKAIARAVSKKGDPEPRGQARGALFRLRKTRTTADFMNELARLQFRYEIDVPNDVLDGRTFNAEMFEEFRGFCVVAALNQFLSATREHRPTPAAPK